MDGTNPLLILPFVLLLGAMALGPMLAPGWWLRYYAEVSLGLGAVTAGIYCLGLRDFVTIGHVAHEYVSFIAFVGSLFVVSGGSFHIKRRPPFANVIFLLAGAVAANVLGTTGAAMLLIRPWIRINRTALAHHIVFFIFIVANVGGCLTPIGDPPLFLGYLQGVPFWWVAENCWPMWATAVGLLLAIFYVVDKIHFPRAAASLRPDQSAEARLEVRRLAEFIFSGGDSRRGFSNASGFSARRIDARCRRRLLFHDPKSIHAANDFNFHPVHEVAILFAGIFATMMPALDWLDTHARGFAGENPSPAIFYWGTGGLSGVLDNAPTYLGFLSALRGATGVAEMPALLASVRRTVAGDQCWRGFFRRGDLHRQRAEFHGQDRGRTAGRADAAVFGVCCQIHAAVSAAGVDSCLVAFLPRLKSWSEI